MSSRFSRTIYVGNLPSDIRENEIEDLFYKVYIFNLSIFFITVSMRKLLFSLFIFLILNTILNYFIFISGMYITMVIYGHSILF